MSDFTDVVERKARKPHKCHDCGRTIDKGEQYKAVRGSHEGGMWSAKHCVHCHALIHAIWAIERENGAGYTDEYTPYGGIFYTLDAWVEPGYHCPQSLFDAFDARWTWPDGSLMSVDQIRPLLPKEPVA